MIEIEGDNVAYFDVDNTLIMWNYPEHMEEEAIDIAIKGTKLKGRVVPHKTHVEQIKHHKIVGNTVVVWSRSGSKWAKTVVEALGLKDYVDVVMSKPFYYYDDKPCCKILGEHRFLDDNVVGV